MDAEICEAVRASFIDSVKLTDDEKEEIIEFARKLNNPDV